MRVGVCFTGAPHPIKEKVRYIKYAEERGLDSAWIAEDYFLREGISTIGSLALATERIKLATSIINPYTRHPVLIAMAIATLDELSNGRMILGLGAAEKRQIEQMGMKYERPLTRMRESIEVIRKLLTGETTTYQGSLVKVKNIQLGFISFYETFGFEGFRPIRTDIPIYIAAIGPKMLQLGGEIADGVLLPVGASPNFVKYALENVKIGAERAGRNPREVDISALITCSVSSNGKKGKDSAKGLVAALVSFRTGSLSKFANQKYVEPWDDEDIRPIKEAILSRGLLEASKLVPDEMVDTFAAAGTREECFKSLSEYKAAGLDTAVLFPAGENVELVIDTAADYINRYG